MTDPFRTTISRLPAVLGLLWFGYGCWCYALLQIRYASFVLPLPARAMEEVDVLPYWVTGLWGIGLAAGLLGALLLLLRRQGADRAFAISLLAGVASLIWRARVGALPEGLAIPTISVVLAAAFFLHARRLSRAPPVSGG